MFWRREICACRYSRALEFHLISLLSDDRHRVKLHPLLGDPNSDYINANYIDVSQIVVVFFAVVWHWIQIVCLYLSHPAEPRSISLIPVTNVLAHFHPEAVIQSNALPALFCQISWLSIATPPTQIKLPSLLLKQIGINAPNASL